MPWRVDVARRLQSHMGEPAGDRGAILAPSRREFEALRDTPPRALAVQLPRGMAARDPGAAGCADSILPESLIGRGGGDGGFDVVVVWLATTSVPATFRRRLLGEVRCLLRVGGALFVVDHNRPRGCWMRARNVVWCLGHGIDPWRRPAYPVAREIQASGLRVASMHLACGERIQIVRALRPQHASGCDERGRAGP